MISLQQVESTLRGQPRLVAIGGIILLCLVGGLLYAPPLMALHKSIPEWRRLKAELTDVRHLMDQLRQGEIPSVPDVDQLSTVLAGLNKLARDHRVQFLEVTPAAPLAGGSPDLMIVPVELQVEGSYRSLGEFLGALRHTTEIGAAFVRRIQIDRDERLLPQVHARLSIELTLTPSSDET